MNNFGRKKRIEGTHMGSKANTPNTCAPRSRRQKDTKAERKLEARIADFNRSMKGSKFAAHKPGSLNRKQG